MTSTASNTARQRRARLLGLLLPGLGQASHGDWLAATCVAAGTAFFWLAALLELIVHNRRGYPAPLNLLDEISALHWPLQIVPDAPVAVVFALTLHIGAAWVAGTARFGLPPCHDAQEA